MRTFACLWILSLCGCGGGGTMMGSPDLAMGGGDDAGGGQAVPELGGASRKFTVVGTAADGLAAPMSLGFAPAHPDQLWVANQTSNGVVIFTNPGTGMQTHEERIDAYGRHFMDKVTSISFGVSNRFASCQESRDDWNDVDQPEDDFMGPTLWLADLDVFARIGQTLPYDPNKPEGSHIDMLHQSPLCMGIAHDRDNVYWAFDGLHGDLVRYDFQDDHGPGGANHSDGIIRRYADATVKRVAHVAGHLVVDHTSALLYVADTGNGRVMALDTNTGNNAGALTASNERLQEYSKVLGAKYTQFAGGLPEPSGIALKDGRLFVSAHGSGEIIAYALDGKELARASTGAKGLMGLAFAPDGKLWFVDATANTLVRIDP